MSKRAYLLNAIQRVRSSYWFLPTVLAGLAVVASEATLYLDRNEDALLYLWPETWRTTQVDGARALLSVIAQSMLGVVGVMFSVTIVAVSFASGNFGPRLIGNFMRDRGTQWSLGILISSFVFALLILRAVHSADEGTELTTFVPHFSIGLALAMTGASIVAVIYYVHHIPETINVSNISAGLGARLRSAVRRVIDNHNTLSEETPVSWPTRDPDVVVSLGRMGYVQNRDDALMTEIAEENGYYIAIVQDVGEFVSSHAPVLRLWSDTPVDDAQLETLRGCFVIGATATEDQNLLFIVQQLVEMLARALSPGVNDPYTAINCLNWMYAALSIAANHEGGLRSVPTSRVWHEPLTFETVFNACFADSLPYVASDQLTLDHLHDVLSRLADECRDTEFYETVEMFQNKITKDRDSSA